VAKPAKTDRQAVIEQMRKKQKSAEKRRGYAIVGVCVVIALLIVGAAAYQPVKDWWDLRKFNDLDLADIGAPASACQKPTTKPADGNQDHVAPGTPVNYTDAPPAFGTHYSEPDPMARKLYTADDRPALGTLVHNLEHGYTILWYDSTQTKGKEQLLRDIADEANKQSESRDKFLVVEWDTSRGKFPQGKPFALAHWAKDAGHRQLCGDLSGEVIVDFVKKYPASDTQEPGAA
jgi:hypothetical protein